MTFQNNNYGKKCPYIHTLNNGQKNDNDKEEETDIKENPVDFRVIAVGWFNNITNTTARSNALVQVEHKTLKDRSRN